MIRFFRCIPNFRTNAPTPFSSALVFSISPNITPPEITTNIISAAALKPLGKAVIKSTKPIGLDLINSKVPGTTINLPLIGDTTRSKLPAGMK